jgi:hypothetical protein
VCRGGGGGAEWWSGRRRGGLGGGEGNNTTERKCDHADRYVIRGELYRSHGRRTEISAPHNVDSLYPATSAQSLKNISRSRVNASITTLTAPVTRSANSSITRKHPSLSLARPTLFCAFNRRFARPGQRQDPTIWCSPTAKIRSVRQRRCPPIGVLVPNRHQ